MMGMRNATSAIEESAGAVKELANSAKEELSGLTSQLRTGAQIAPYIIIGTAILSAVALVVALVAIARD